MVEGPGVHRVAIARRKLFLGQRLRASSPNEKFKDGAALIDGQLLALIDAHGKNLFYFFTRSELANSNHTVLEDLPEDVTVVNIHFGMSGCFRTYNAPGPEPRPATRLRLVDEKVGIVAHLSANVCSYGSLDFYRKKVECLGPDPLRKDGDKEHLWASLQKSKKKIGAVLMDQSLIAGIGNIYRTGKAFSKLRKGEKRYIYNHKQCRRCDGDVQSWKMAQRTVYACEACQPLTIHKTETQKSGGSFHELILAKDHHRKLEEHAAIQKHSNYSKTSRPDLWASTVVSKHNLMVLHSGLQQGFLLRRCRWYATIHQPIQKS